jgi:hypothetical protein
MPMPICKMLLQHEPRAFGPQDITTLIAAFESVRVNLQLDRDDPMGEIIASRIISLWREGERDPILLCHRVIQQMTN